MADVAVVCWGVGAARQQGAFFTLVAADIIASSDSIREPVRFGKSTWHRAKAIPQGGEYIHIAHGYLPNSSESGLGESMAQ